MNIGERFHDAMVPESRELNAKGCRALAISHLSGLSFSEPPRLSQVGKRMSSSATDLKSLSRLLLRPTRESLSPQLASSMRREATSGKASSQPAANKSLRKPKVQPNDIVVFANHAGTWKVVAAVNGSKADIRRSRGFDTRIVTTGLESLTVVRRAGSPGYSY